ncbi:unnamed protein product, partial [marine sediment metagenome]
HAVVSPMATFGYGVYVGPGTKVAAMACLGNHCSIMANAHISHDNQLGDFVYCANSVSISGGVSIGSTTYIGANSTIREYTNIGNRAIIGMGSVVVKDVADGQIVVGNPAKPIKNLTNLKLSDGTTGNAK